MESAGEDHLAAHTTALYAILVVLLVLGAGLMSGLTLGLLSLDVMDLEVLRVSGTARQQSAAARLIPLVAKPHWLLCTLLLCNAGCMEALPLFLDRLLNPVIAILLSVTAILLFGEIIPQAVCSRYGVAIGSTLAPLVRVLMLVCSPISWPLGKLLDWTLGHENVAMKRQQLKAMVQLHGEGAGLGGKLTAQEVSVISGAIDLRYKTAISAMTPLCKVFMVSDQALLEEGLVRAMLHSGHSRVPVYRGHDTSDFAGLILVKEVLQFWRCAETPRVSQLSLRPIPRLPADTPMFDMLRFFQTGNSHMALLTAPEGSDLDEFKRTRAFVMTKDEDDSSCSSSSSSSSESCSSSSADIESGGPGRSTTGSISSSIRWLGRRTGKRKDRRASADEQRSQKCPPSIAGSDIISSTQCPSPCGCSCHHHHYHQQQHSHLAAQHAQHSSMQLSTASSCACDGAAGGSGQQQQHSNSPSACAGPLCVAQRVCSSQALSPLFLPTPGVNTGCSFGSSGCAGVSSAAAAVDGAAPSRSSGSSPSLGSPAARQHSLASAADATHSHQHQAQAQQQQQQGLCRSSYEQAHMSGDLPQVCNSCLCVLPQPHTQMHVQQPQQDSPHHEQQMSAPVLQSHPVSLHHHHHHHQHHHHGRQHHEQQQDQADSAQQHDNATPLVLQHASSSGSGSARNPGSVSTLPVPAGRAAAVPNVSDPGSAGAAAAGVMDEGQDKLGPLLTPQLLHQQQQQHQPHMFAPISNSQNAAGVQRQVPVGIITLEDVIEELMQAEIVDETDAYMDNDKTKRVDLHQLMEQLPPNMLATLRAEMLQAAQNFIKHATWTPGPGLNPNNVRQLTAIRAVTAAAAAASAPASSAGGVYGAPAAGAGVSSVGGVSVPAAAPGAHSGGAGAPGGVASAGSLQHPQISIPGGSSSGGGGHAVNTFNVATAGAGAGAAVPHNNSSNLAGGGGGVAAASAGPVVVPGYMGIRTSTVVGASPAAAAAAVVAPGVMAHHAAACAGGGGGDGNTTANSNGGSSNTTQQQQQHKGGGGGVFSGLLHSVKSLPEIRSAGGQHSSDTVAGRPAPARAGSFTLARRAGSGSGSFFFSGEGGSSQGGGGGGGGGNSTAGASTSAPGSAVVSPSAAASAAINIPMRPWLRMRAASSPANPLAATPATASPGLLASALTLPAGGGAGGYAGMSPAVGSAGAAGAGGGTRSSAPGVLSGANVKPVAKVFKSAPSPLLSAQ